jgi:transposase-like protein
VARYGQAFRDRVVARLLPPESASVDEVSREVGVDAQTLERWLSDALSRPARERAWTVAARQEAVIATAAMDEAARSAWCRENGVYPQQLQQWRENVSGLPIIPRLGKLGDPWHVAHVAQFAGGVALATEPGIAVGLRLVGVVAAPLPPEVLGRAATFSVLAVALGRKALVPGPGLDERAVHAEVLTREQVALVRDRHHLVEGQDDRIVLDQALAVPAEYRRHPHRIVHRQEPAKQQVVLNLLHQLPLGANAVENLLWVVW